MEYNKKFENLFSQDPVGAFKKIEEDFLRYFKTIYKISDEELDKERVRKLTENNNLFKEPYIELLPEYKAVEGLNDLDDLVYRYKNNFGDEKIASLFFKEFISKGLMNGLMKNYKPYGHQIGMLDKAFAGRGEDGQVLKYKNTVITSGTGSGKTESFLLPLLADIFKESKKWNDSQVSSNWYTGVLEGRAKINRVYKPLQREGDERPAALRALVLYPMNALVEDQMSRLREALDSDEVRSFMDKKLGKNRIYFGSYNGSTIAHQNYKLLQQSLNEQAFKAKKKQVLNELKEIHNNYINVREYVNNDNSKKEVLYIAPRLGDPSCTSEMITRWDMQEWAPDIMITNTSMLSIMLMRKAERDIFEKTKKWLNAEDLPECEREEARKERIFHIVVDELHLYRGTAGSEVACLLRMLYNAVGLKPVIDDGNGNLVPNPQIKILTSSASLGDETQTQAFLEEFFGIYSTIEGEKVFNIQRGSDYKGEDSNLPEYSNLQIDYTIFSDFTHENFIALELNQSVEETADLRLKKCNEFIKQHFNLDSINDFCDKYQTKIFKDFYDVMEVNTDGTKKPISEGSLINKLFAGKEESYRGFLIFRAHILIHRLKDINYQDSAFINFLNM